MFHQYVRIDICRELNQSKISDIQNMNLALKLN